MIISRTPYRISFFGGGTDYPKWYEEHDGSVLSATINKYSYITCKVIPQIFDYKYRLRYFKTEQVDEIDQINHPSFRESLRFHKINEPLELVHTGDLPAGTGLGSSSSFTVGLVNILNAHLNNHISKRKLALDSINIEQNFIKECVGSQDQVACSFGGLNNIKFNKSNVFEVNPIVVNNSTIKNLEDHLCLFFTGFTRNASSIAQDQINNLSKNYTSLNELKDQVDLAIDLLYKNNINDFGKLLNEQWRLKKSLSCKISSTFIDSAYDKAMSLGALGGKILGAGSGGFLIFIIDPNFKEKLISKMDNLHYVPINFENLGSQIIYYSR